MARDHARIHLDIWGDDDWLDLPADAQCLYMTLYTSPGRTLCGAHEWSPSKLAQRAADWTVPRIEAAAETLSQQLFLIIDTDTDECLLRSWIKHDGLWRTPNMAVSVANARANLASRILRGVIVFEVLKLRAAEPKSTSWERPAVQSMLGQKAIDPASLEPFNGAHNPDPNGGRNGGVNPASNGAANPYGQNGAKGGSKGGPTNAFLTNATATKSDDDDSQDEPPLPAAEPEYIDNAAKPTKQHPSSAAKTVVRQELGTDAPYPRQTIERLAVQVDKLFHADHPDALIREAIREWDRREDARLPEFLPSVYSDCVKRARAQPGNTGRPANKLRAVAELAQRERAREQAAIETTETPKGIA
ncbi:hypothetical protein [Mycobacterium sp. TY814]|uniref:hypothetical protein n=1 Tax=Mycobacterium sp. TY814 TaxID=3050580 RepID=UPI0027410BE5|nr:hypothetical protein [Mycobacterium sp. TY814]MDP7721812.1 hypothetical protein [Mycobacterium sp. TY814]